MSRKLWSSLFSLIVVVAAFCISATASAQANVKSVNSKKRTVVLTEGKNSGFEKGARVCFYNNSDKKMVCAKIAKASAKSALVRLSQKSIGRVKKGMTVKLEDASTSIASSSSSSSSGSKYTLRAGYIYTPMAPINYNSLHYAGITSTNKVNTLWEPTAIKQAAIGFGGEFGLAFSDRLDFTVGLRYRLYTKGFSSQLKTESDYVAITESDKSKYVISTQEASGMGGYLDYALWKKPVGKNGLFKLKAGLDVEMFSLKFEAAQAEDNVDGGTLIAEAEASKTAIGVRLGGSFDYKIAGPVTLSLGLNAMFVAAESGEVTANVTDPNASQYLNGDANEDLIYSIDAKKGGAALEVLIGLGASF